MFEQITEHVKQRVTGQRNVVVEGIPVSYYLFSMNGPYDHDNLEWCWVDADGNIYVSGLPGGAYLRHVFEDLVAFHERLEYDWLKELRLPAPRYKTRPGTRENEIAGHIHNQVHYLELKAAQNLGILDEYLDWRPHGHVTEEFYKKLSKD